MLTMQIGACWVAQLVKNPPAMQETSSIPESGSSPAKRIGYPLQNSWVSLVAQMVKKVKKKVKSLSPVRLFAIPWTINLPSFSIHGILPARIPAWVAISFSWASS